jgi:hypothetical protein
VRTQALHDARGILRGVAGRTAATRRHRVQQHIVDQEKRHHIINVGQRKALAVEIDGAQRGNATPRLHRKYRLPADMSGGRRRTWTLLPDAECKQHQRLEYEAHTYHRTFQCAIHSTDNRGKIHGATVLLLVAVAQQ